VRVFFDTNVLVSAFATRGLGADLLELVLIEHDLITGRNVLKELERVLRTKIRLPAARCAEIVEFVDLEASTVIENAVAADCEADEDDKLVLGEAIAGESEVFITGDAAVLAIGEIGAMRILTPRQLWETLRTQ
jgi:putative PIN family toxin of toxin-antitoxin system